MEAFGQLVSQADYTIGENVVIVYHDHCHDGVTAAWAASRRFPDASFYAASYATPVDVARFGGKHVLVVDFCWPRQITQELLSGAHPVKSLTVLDHHVTSFHDVLRPVSKWLEEAPANVVDRLYFTYDVNRSGAGITWDVLFAGRRAGVKTNRHPVIDLVEDRDLWRFTHTDTRAFHAYADTLPLDIVSRSKLADIGRVADGVIEAGRAILRYQEALVEDIARHATITNFRVTHDQAEVFYEVPVIVLPSTKVVSEVLGKLAPGFPFAAGIIDVTPTAADAHVASVSLRSAPDALNVGDIAKTFGGGGHAHASAFTIKRADLDARIFPTGRRVFPA